MNQEFPWLTTLMLLPLVGGVVVALLPRKDGSALPKQVALGISVLTLVVSIAVAVGYSLGLLRPIASLAYAGYEATQMVATLKELLLQLRETVQAASLLVPSKDQALPLLREVGKKYFGL